MDAVFGRVDERAFAVRAERFGARGWVASRARGREEGEGLMCAG